MTRRTDECPAPGPGGVGRVSVATAEVAYNGKIARDLYRIRLLLPGPWGPPEPGQFVSLTLEPPWDEMRPGDAGTGLLRRPFSLAAAAAEERRWIVEILYAPVGKVTRQICRLPAGARLDVLGPAGTAFPIPAGAPSVLVGGGRGIAPLLFLAGVLHERALPFSLLYGTQSSDQWAPLGQLAPVALLSTEDGSGGVQGTVIDLLDRLRPEGRRVVMACGPQGMLAAVARWSQQRGFECWVSVESVFGCGIGICGGCAVPACSGGDAYERFLWACRDGPVVPAQRIDWEAWGSGDS